MSNTTTPTKERILSAAGELFWSQSYNSTCVDSICKESKVQKGSFYHHFPSKLQLTEAVMESKWQDFRGLLESSFAKDLAPLERFRRYFRQGLAYQQEAFAARGKVYGCPVFTLGAEVSTQEPALQAKVNSILEQTAEYYVGALRDMQTEGTLSPNANVRALAWRILTYCEGAMTLARIQNNLVPIEATEAAVLQMIGAKAY